jgi:hypothetical protein
MRCSIRIALLAAFGLLGARPAAAKDMNGRFGVGAERTLGGVQGVDIMYWVGRIAINGTANLGLSFPDVGDTGVRFAIAGGLLFQLVGGDRADLSVGGRLNIGTAQGTDPQIALEAPLRLEWYASEHLSIHGEVGVAITVNGDKGGSLVGAGPLPINPGTGFAVGGTYLTAGAGFDVYF